MSKENAEIFSAQYPSAAAVLAGSDPLEPLTAEAVQASFQQFLRRMEQAVYEPDPEKAAGSREFIALAKDLSESFQVDMDILDRGTFLQADLYLDCAVFLEEMTHMLGQLIRMSDRMSFSLPGTRPDCVNLTLDYVTHQEV